MENKNFKFFLKKILEIVSFLLKYPFRVKKKYESMNAIILMMVPRISERSMSTKSLFKIRKKNISFINFGILLPIYIGSLISVMVLFLERHKYMIYSKRMFLPIQADGFFDKSSLLFKRIYLGILNQPIEWSHIQWFIYGYLIALIVAYILMQANPMITEQERIRSILAKSKKVNEYGEPWFVLWTPEYIYFNTYNCDPDDFVFKQKPFWNTISYNPSEYILFKEDSNKFIVPKKYELDSKIILDFRGLI